MTQFRAPRSPQRPPPAPQHPELWPAWLPRRGVRPGFPRGAARAPEAAASTRQAPPPERPFFSLPPPPQHAFGAGSRTLGSRAPQSSAGAAAVPGRRGPVVPSLSRETCALFSSSRSPEWGGNVGSCGRHRGCSWSCLGLFYLAVTSSLSEPGSAWRSPERPALGTVALLSLCASG